MDATTNNTSDNATFTPYKHVVIVGGGTAGWMSANLIANRWCQAGVKVRLVESKDIGIIGVGEGSTPYLRMFFSALNIPESEWMPACNATYKCGIRFPNWSTKNQFQEYVHPFFGAQDMTVGSKFYQNARLRVRGAEVDANPADFFIAGELARQRKAPHRRGSLQQEQQTPIEYAYHFDAGLLGQFLKSHAMKLGVLHQIGNIATAKQLENGDIAHLVLEDGRVVDGDLFIDCSGFRGLLINETLGEPFISFRNNLFNDSAIAIPTAIDPTEDIPCETVSSAIKHGWVWKIPLTQRYGNGYVYSSDFISPEEAEKELRAHLGPAAEQSEARHLKMRVGRVEHHWRNNCLAIGLSQGFIEPLEATALAIIQLTLERFMYDLVPEKSIVDCQASFNHRVNQFFEGIRDYVVTHYRLNSRNDSDYWIENRRHNHISERLGILLEAWDKPHGFDAVLAKYSEELIFTRSSWYCILAGMGRFPDQLTPHTAPVATAQQARAALAQFVAGFHGHREYLDHLKSS